VAEGRERASNHAERSDADFFAVAEDFLFLPFDIHIMKEHFRQSMAWLHTWTGLLAGWVMFFVFVTGTAAFFNDEITRWMKPELPLRVEQHYPPTAEMAERALDFLARQREPSNYWLIWFPTDGERIGNRGIKGRDCAAIKPRWKLIGAREGNGSIR
jgi:hypothetical protein